MLGDRPQGVAGDCNSLAETHARFDSWVAHHSVFLKQPTTCRCGIVFIFPWVVGKQSTRDLAENLRVRGFCGGFPESLSGAFTREVLSWSNRPQRCAIPRTRRCSSQSSDSSGSARSVLAVRLDGWRPSRIAVEMSGASQTRGRMRLTDPLRRPSRSVICWIEDALPSRSSLAHRLASATSAIRS